jgi:hypothetical protein
LTKLTSKQEIGKSKQQGNKNDWKQQAPLNINNECKWPQCPNQMTQNSKVQKQDPTICCLQETHLTEKINIDLESKGEKRFSKQMNSINRQE